MIQKVSGYITMHNPCISPIFAGLLFLVTAVTPAVVNSGPSLIQSRPAPHTDNSRINLADVLSDSTTTTVNSSSTNSANVACNSRLFGSQLNLVMCMEALDLIPRGQEEKSFGIRYDPVGRQADVKLPYRWLSRK